MTLAAWSKVTRNVKLGLRVGANTFRNAALTAKMATTLDHMSGGRAHLGIGGAWFKTEHTAYGIDFGSGFGERLDRLDEAVRIMRGMLNGEGPSGDRAYATTSVRNDPPVRRPVRGANRRRACDATGLRRSADRAGCKSSRRPTSRAARRPNRAR